MIATITGLHQKKKGNGTDYVRVTFAVCEHEGEKPKWAKTDLCPSYRNWRFWRDHVAVGARFRVSMRDPTTVDADVPPTFLGMQAPPAAPPPDPQLGLF
jgi:hypothetical protein